MRQHLHRGLFFLYGALKVTYESAGSYRQNLLNQTDKLFVALLIMSSEQEKYSYSELKPSQKDKRHEH